MDEKRWKFKVNVRAKRLQCISWSPKTWERYLSETHNSRIRADFWSQDGLSQISQEEYQEAIAVRTPLSDYKQLRNHLEHAMSFLSPFGRA